MQWPREGGQPCVESALFSLFDVSTRTTRGFPRHNRLLGHSSVLIVAADHDGDRARQLSDQREELVHGILRIAIVLLPGGDGFYDPPLPENIMRLPACFLEDYGTETDHHRAVRPAFNALWNAIGYSKSQFFDEDGHWRGRKL